MSTQFTITLIRCRGKLSEMIIEHIDNTTVGPMDTLGMSVRLVIVFTFVRIPNVKDG